MEIPKQIDTNEKKAWFMVGYLYNLAVKNRKARGSVVSGENEAFKFQQIRANNQSFFKIIADDIIPELCTNNNLKLAEFHKSQIYSEMCQYHTKSENQLTNDEAKYYFSWGTSV